MKERLDELALLGGDKSFAEPLHVGRPNIGNRRRLFELLDDALDRRWLTNDGPYVEELEQRIAAKMGVAHCITACNGTVALEIAIRAAELRGDVIVPSFTFVATAHALQWQGLNAVFCDVDPLTHNLDPALVEKLITPRTSGIIGVHLWGRPCDVGALTSLATRHGLKLIFDAAQAFGCSKDGQMIGSFGDAEVFSFHATKSFHTFEGGAVLSNNDALASRVRLMKNFGFVDYDTVVSVGTNGKMSEVSAAMGLTSLESFAEVVEINRRNYLSFRRGLEHVPGIEVLAYDEKDTSNYHCVVLEVDDSRANISRDALQRVLWAENVLARRYFYPGCHRMEPYKSLSASGDALLPNTERLADRVLSLPTGPTLSVHDVTMICDIVRLAVTYGCELTQLLMHPTATSGS